MYHSHMQAQPLQLYLTVEHDCSYLPDQKAATLVPDPQVAMNMALYSQLIQHGYRRSGSHTYKPHCENCQACIACRLPVARFKANRNQRRCLKNNQDLELRLKPAGYSDEYFQLYTKYLNHRHADGGMANPSSEDFSQFLYCDWSETVFLEIRNNKRLIAVAVTDITSNGLSSVYTFFDPDESKRSPGTYAILQQVQQAELMKKDYLYMGYWINDCQKMLYKANYRPMEYLSGNKWLETKAGF